MKQNTAELRKNFEKRLIEFLKKELSHLSGSKFTRNRINITRKESGAVANIHFEYLTNTRSYEAIILVEQPVLQAAIAQMAPPYPSNLANARFVYSMSTTSEKDACIDLPTTEQGIENACERMLALLNGTYLPIVLNALETGPAMVDDILARPKYYSHPVPLIFTVLKINGIQASEESLARILSEQTLGYTNHHELKNAFHQHLASTSG